MLSLDLDVLQHTRDWLAAGRRAWLVTVAQTFGASPRPPGSLLAIRDDGVLVGSVSGGCIEDDLIARRNEYTGRVPAFATYGVTSDEARRFGLPCGGTLDVIIEADVALADVDALLARIRNGEVVARSVDLANGSWSLAPGQPAQPVTRDERRFTCVHGPRWRLLIVGASEIGRYLAEIAPTLDFQVFVCDPREEYRASWQVASARWVDGMPDDAVTAFKPDPHSVIVTVSHDPKLDDMALMTALTSDAFYVGAVGSAKTSADRRTRLIEQLGMKPADVARLHGPVGLSIGSRTPPEIALALLAELVAQRNRIVLVKAEGKAQRAA